MSRKYNFLVKVDIEIAISLEKITNIESYCSLSRMGRTRLFSDGSELVSESLDGFKSRKNENS